jgi:geranylgeranyl pyrophosphate synthase
LLHHCVGGGKQVRGLLFLNTWNELQNVNNESHSGHLYELESMSRVAWALEMVVLC